MRAGGGASLGQPAGRAAAELKSGRCVAQFEGTFKSGTQTKKKPGPSCRGVYIPSRSWSLKTGIQFDPRHLQIRSQVVSGYRLFCVCVVDLFELEVIGW